MIRLEGRMSWFGGPDDHGVGPGEGLALYSSADHVALHPELFLPHSPPGTTGLARRLDPSKYFIATRWDYHKTPPGWLRSHQVRVTRPSDSHYVDCWPVDWGPNSHTGRIADLSRGVCGALGLDTDDTVIVEIPEPGDAIVHPPIIPVAPTYVNVPSHLLPHPVWPLQRDCPEFYGDPRRQGWLHANTIDVACPWQLWFGKVPVQHILIHKKCADSLERVLKAIWYGAGESIDKIKGLHYDQFSGSYNLRVMRGGGSLSMHSYACAIDFYDAGNPFHSETHAFYGDSLIVKAFEGEGWVWGGAWAPGSIDAMHFQAARIHP